MAENTGKPNETACKIIATTAETYAIVIDKFQELWTNIEKLGATLFGIKWGSLPDLIAADLLATIGAIAAKMAATLMGSVSKIGAAILEQIISNILKILLASPTAIYSLVAMPHEQARKALTDEKRYLKRAQGNLNNVIRIVRKWTDGKSGTDYIEQMRRAMPFILKAISLSERMILELDGEPTKEGETKNSVFNESAFKRLQDNIQSAIDITVPESFIEKQLQLEKQIEKHKADILRERTQQINAFFNRRRKDLTASYMKSRPDDEDDLSLSEAAVEQEKRVAYMSGLEAIEAGRDSAIAGAEVEAEAIAIKRVAAQGVGNFWNTATEEFFNDMQYLGKQLYSFHGNIKDAFLKYKEYQIYCNTMINMRGLILQIVEWLVSALRGIGNASAETASAGIEQAMAALIYTRDSFRGTINSAGDPYTSMPATTAAANLTAGNIALQGAQSVLDILITDSLIDLINSDDILEADNVKYDKFITDLANIRDWDGETGVWAVDLLAGATSPYIQAIADATTALTLLPALGISPAEDDKRRVRRLVRDMNKVFKRLQSHNREVEDVINSYSPYMSSAAGDLKSVLEQAGLLNEFCSAMNLASILTSIGGGLIKDGLLSDGTENSYDNCKEAYPELFDSEYIQEYGNISRRDFAPKETNTTFMSKAEASELERSKVENEVRSTDITADEKETEGDPESTPGYSP